MKEKVKTQIDKIILEFIIHYIEENGYAPSYREIQCGVGESTGKVLKSIKCLEEMGKIKTKLKTARAISVIGYEFVKIEQAAE